MEENYDFNEFLKDLKLEIYEKDDSRITSRLSQYKQHINTLDTKLDERKQSIKKLKNSFKNYYRAITNLIDAEYLLAECLTRFNSSETNEEIYSAMVIFPDLFKDSASRHNKHLLLVSNLLFFPLKQFLEKDCKSLSDIRKTIEDSFKDYKNKELKMDREMKKKNDIVLYRSENAEIESSRHTIEYNICQYAIRHEEIDEKLRYGLLENLIEYNFTLEDQLKSSLRNREGFKSIFDFWYKNEITKRRTVIDERKKELTALKHQIKTLLPTVEKVENDPISTYKLHGESTDKDFGFCKAGPIFKKTEGFRRIWQKRYCVVTKGLLRLSHGVSDPVTAQLSLLTSQVKLLPPDKDNKKSCFVLISANRKFYFATESEAETKAWFSVINNSREREINKAIEDGSSKHPADYSGSIRTGVDLLKMQLKAVAGNNVCADCFAENPEWVSTNLGILVCIECSGIHREMGVRVSRIRSISIDFIQVWELFLVCSIGNFAFNEVMDPSPENHKIISKESTMEERRVYLNEKYVERKYVQTQAVTTDGINIQSLLNFDLLTILYLYANGYDFSTQEESMGNTTFLHQLVSQEKQQSMGIVEFLVQNCSKLLNITDSDGNTPLHLALSLLKLNYSKILIRAGSDLHIKNNSLITPYDMVFESPDMEFMQIKDAIINKRLNRLQVDFETMVMHFGFLDEAVQEAMNKQKEHERKTSEGSKSQDSTTLNRPLSFGSVLDASTPGTLIQNKSFSQNVSENTPSTSIVDEPSRKASRSTSKSNDVGRRSVQLKSTHKTTPLSFSNFHFKLNHKGLTGEHTKIRDSKKGKNGHGKSVNPLSSIDSPSAIICSGTLDIKNTKSLFDYYDTPKSKAVVVRSFQPLHDDSKSLSLEVGEELIVTELGNQSDFYYGFKIDNEKIRGLIPQDYVQIVKKI